jgi:hypothetical protein
MRSIGLAAMAVGMLGLLASGAEGAAAVAPEPAPVVMRVRNVGELHGQAVVLLEGGEPRVILPIWIGPSEASAIDLRLRNQKAPRPLTADLLETTLATLGAKVDRVEVIDLRDNTFIGRLTLRDAQGAEHLIDARPSDLIALAIGAHLPVLVAPHVLAQAGLDAAKLHL